LPTNLYCQPGGVKSLVDLGLKAERQSHRKSRKIKNQKKSQNQKSEKVAKSKIGNIRRIELDGKSFTYCTRYFDLSSCHDENAPVEFYKDCDLEYFDYDGIIKPDIRIENRVEDLNNCRDTQLEESLRIIKNEMNYSIYMDKE